MIVAFRFSITAFFAQRVDVLTLLFICTISSRNCGSKGSLQLLTVDMFSELGTLSGQEIPSSGGVFRHSISGGVAPSVLEKIVLSNAIKSHSVLGSHR
jgi:hypothetical protein